MGDIMLKKIRLSIIALTLAVCLAAGTFAVPTAAKKKAKKAGKAKTETVAADETVNTDDIDQNEKTEKADPEKEEESEYKGKVVANVKDYVNVRKHRGTDHKIIGKMKKGDMGEIIKRKKGWTKIESGSITGYVKDEYLVFEDDIPEFAEKHMKKKATVQVETLRVRRHARKSSYIVTLVDQDKSYTVIKEKKNWVKIKTPDGKGYVKKEYVKVGYKFGVAKTVEQFNAGDTGDGDGSSVLSYAQQFVGNPYVYGGSSLTGGTDCSGFVMSVFAKYGIYLPHSSAAMRGYGREVSYSEMRPGDVVCYSGHVGIYAGGGRLLSALGKKWGITYNDVNYKHIITIRRMM